MKAFPSEKKLYWLFRQGDKPIPNEVVEQGMDLRDYFAAKALEGYLAAKSWHPDFEMKFGKDYSQNGKAQEIVSEVCYTWADAMMKARAK